MVEINRLGSPFLRPSNEEDITPPRQLSDVEFLLSMLRDGGPLDQLPPGETPIGQPGIADKSAVVEETKKKQIQEVNPERLKSIGTPSATEKLLGLNQKPSVLGAIDAPPGNSMALRYLTPAMRRATIRELIIKQRKRLRGLAYLLHGEESEDEQSFEENKQQETTEEIMLETSVKSVKKITPLRRETAIGELDHTVRMLNLLSDFLAMQDYILSQMSSFSKG